MKQVGKVAIWILGLVFLAVIILQSGRYSFVQDNSSANFGPSGTSAFVELLKRNKYQVTVDKFQQPKLETFQVMPVNDRNTKNFKDFVDQLEVKTPTTILALYIPRDEGNGNPTEVVNMWSGQTVGKIQPFEPNPTETLKPLSSSEFSFLSKSDRSTPVASIQSKKNLKVVYVSDARMLTNEHLDKVDNADVVMGLVRMLAKGNPKLVVAEVFGANEVNSSLIAKLGPPFEAAWNQVLILILVIFVTLSIRFGLAPEHRLRQRGGRELVDGLANMTKRKRNARWALRAVFDRTLSELERRHRVGREQIMKRPELYLPGDQIMILSQAEAATFQDITEQQAIGWAKELQRLV